MLIISAEFLHGTYRADPDGGAVTGRAEAGEWPPSVARLLAAFVAADGMGDDCRFTSGTELEFLEGLGPPVIHADASPHHQRLEPRYVVQAFKSVTKIGKEYPSNHQEYPARKGALVRPGVRVAVKHQKVVYVWHDIDPTSWLESLRLRAARIGYLGCADSPIRVRVAATLDDGDTGALHTFHPRAEGTCMVSVPRPGRHLAALAAAYESWLRDGTSVSRSQFPALRNLTAYAGPDDTIDKDEAGAVVAWLRLEPGVPGRRIADVTAALKAATMSRYQRLYGDPLPRELHGHGFESKGFEIARYLALPNVGHPHSDGRILGAAVWLPRDCDNAVVERVRSAARSLDLLRGPKLEVKVAPWRGDGPLTARPNRWRRKSATWVTAVPAIHERFGRLTLFELQRWCRHAGLPEPVAFRRARVPLVGGALNLHPSQVDRDASHGRDAAKPYSHIAVRFAEAVRGPVVIGGGRSRGFGLCIPLDDESAAPRDAGRWQKP
ncbi:MAG: type I-U CRISPR-associated protein Cas5/Cas6 [Acidimicrobiaceae bacterium]|nr:type I-U CRISPR-associated protein Cas5/Cas6 [Acidimicrobiaceae bacterium]MYE69975.1 type I-U CRISPR-associated protein Cas5/Cas6 [Gemmatimonadota bacterium]